MLKKLALLGSIVLTSPTYAAGLVVQGDVFADTCHKSEPDRQAACTGFIAGVANSYLNSGLTCIPPSTDPREVTDFVRYWVDRNPGLVRPNSAASLVVLALKSRWPCSGVGGPRITFQLRGFPGFQYRGF